MRVFNRASKTNRGMKQEVDVGRRANVCLLGAAVLAGTSVMGCAGNLPHNLSHTKCDWLGEQSRAQHGARYTWLAQAALAPSAHNMQPWLVDLGQATDLLKE